MPRIAVRLDNIDSAIRELERYRDSLSDKCDRLREIITKKLEAEVREGFNGAFYDGLLYEGWKVPSVAVSSDNGKKVNVVIASGKEAIFIEFGAGVYYNPTGAPHPARGQGIVAIGEYGKGHGKRSVWGYYGDDGNLHLTHGTPASMPMYHAAMSIAREVPKLAKQVFGGDFSG